MTARKPSGLEIRNSKVEIRNPSGRHDFGISIFEFLISNPDSFNFQFPSTCRVFYLIALLFLSSGVLSAYQARTIEGQVLDAVTNAPIAGALVRVAESSATTGRDGRFALKDVAGEYGLVVSKSGYASLESAEREERTYRLTPAGVLTGRIVDDEGRPMRGVQVQAMVYGYQDGRHQMVRRGTAVATNDRGEFRLFWLDPGRYYIVVTQQALPGQIRYIPSIPDLSFVTTYYPGTADVARAEAIVVGSGEVDVHAIPMATLPTHLIHIQIRNLNSTYGSPVFILATLRQLDDRPYAPLYEFPRPGLIGTGEVRVGIGAEPGRYRIGLRINMPEATYLGTATVTLDRSEETKVDVPVVRGVTIQGRLEMGEIPPSVSVTCTSDPSMGTGISVTAPVRPDGKFTLEYLFPEKYSLRLKGLPDDAYLASPDTFDVAAGTPPQTLSMIVKNDGGRVRGVAGPGTTVVLIPDVPLRSRLDRFKSAKTNSAGEFQIRGIAPGNYAILAFEQIEDGAHQDMTFLKDFESRGHKLAVGASSEIKVDPPWIPKR